MSLDYLGNPIDTDDHDARRALDDFIGGFIGYQPRAEAILASADCHPESALSNALAGILLMFVESPEGPALAEAYRRRAAGVASPQPRAALYLQLLQAWISDDLDRVLSLADRLQAQYPRDLFAAKLNQYVEFNRGNWPALLRVGLKAVAAAPDIAQSHGMLAFAFEQCHLLEEAEASARQALALQRFAEANPQLLEEIRELDAREQAQQIEWAFEDAAEELGIQPWELALQLIAETPEQLQAMRLETHREVAEALGMEWEEYCQFNEIEPE